MVPQERDAILFLRLSKDSKNLLLNPKTREEEERSVCSRPGKTWMCTAEKARLLIKTHLGLCQMGERDSGPGAWAKRREEVAVYL